VGTPEAESGTSGGSDDLKEAASGDTGAVEVKAVAVGNSGEAGGGLDREDTKGDTLREVAVDGTANNMDDDDVHDDT